MIAGHHSKLVILIFWKQTKSFTSFCILIICYTCIFWL